MITLLLLSLFCVCLDLCNAQSLCFLCMTGHYNFYYVGMYVWFTRCMNWYAASVARSALTSRFIVL